MISDAVTSLTASRHHQPKSGVRRSAWRQLLAVRTIGLIPLVAIALIVPCAVALAATDTDTFQVTATVADSCSVTGNDLGFGNYDPVSGTPLSATTTVDVTCTLDTAYEIGLDAGTGAGANVTVRRMTSGGNTLDYSLYQDAGFTTVWGDTVGVNTISDTGTGAVQNHTVHGRIPASQFVPAGAYSDTITVTVTY